MKHEKPTLPQVQKSKKLLVLDDKSLSAISHIALACGVDDSTAARLLIIAGLKSQSEILGMFR